jgi:hypothetical protein
MGCSQHQAYTSTGTDLSLIRMEDGQYRLMKGPALLVNLGQSVTELRKLLEYVEQSEK